MLKALWKQTIFLQSNMVGIDADFSDVDQFFEDGTSEVVAGMKEEGEAFVEDAKATGNYQDHTKHLRESNDYEVNEDGLILKTKLIMLHSWNPKDLKLQEVQR